MKKTLSILTIVLFLFSCTEKEKTYEELEAEVLCDVLPEIAKYELNQNQNKIHHQLDQVQYLYNY